MSKRKRPRVRLVLRRIGVAIVAVAFVAAIGYGGFAAANDPRMSLGKIDVQGAHRTSVSTVIEAAALPSGRNVWLLDTRSAATRVESLPWVATARVTRRWPNHLTIVVEERAPVAQVWLSAGGSSEEPTPRVALIDATLRVLATGAPDPAAARLPVFRIRPAPANLLPGSDASGGDVEGAYDALVQLRALGLGILEVDLAPATGIGITTSGGLHVILGSGDEFAKKVELYKAILPKIASPQNVVYVDLRSVRAPTVLYR